MDSRLDGPESQTLPAAATSFVGRRHQIDELMSALESARVVVALGPGGVGKTRMAIEVARQSKGRFGECLLAELASSRRDQEVVPAVARAVGVTDQSHRSVTSKVVDQLEGRDVLLVLDNCEHVLDGVVSLVDALVRELPRLRILATSRTAMGISEEYRYPVPQLSTPVSAVGITAAQLVEYESGRLLVDRATAAVPGFSLSDDNAQAAAALCIQLEGIPLAIELAVARLRTLTLSQIVDRTGGSLDLLALGSRTAESRQRTMRSLIEWSFDLCSPAEQRLWCRLSVFEGGFDLDAAEAVCSDKAETGQISTCDILDVLGALVDQSILHTDRTEDRLRFHMLETIKAYGFQKLTESGQAAVYRRRHRTYFLAVAKHFASQWTGTGQVAASRAVDLERDNLRAVMDESSRDGDDKTPLELVGALRYRWYADGFHAEGRKWLDEALAPATSREHPTAPRARALWVCAWVCLLQGDRISAAQRLEECEAVATELELPVDLAYVHKLRGLAAFFDGDLLTAATHLSAAVPELQRRGEVPGYLFACFEYSLVLTFSGRSEEASVVLTEALEVSRACGDRWARAHLEWSRGIQAWIGGDHPEAERLSKRAIDLHKDFHTAVGTAWMTELLAWAALARNAVDEADALRREADEMWRRTGTGYSAFGPYLAGMHDTFSCRLASYDGPRADPGAGGRAHEETPLTARQMQIVKMVSTGMSNRQIAESLVLSVRTVDSHVERILTRLGLRSRTEVAAWYLTRPS